MSPSSATPSRGFFPKNLLVTGGCGFIGSWLVRYLLATDPDVRIVNLDLLAYSGLPENLREVEAHPCYRFVHGDIRDERLVSALMRDHGIDACINVAAQTHVD